MCLSEGKGGWGGGRGLSRQFKLQCCIAQRPPRKRSTQWFTLLPINAINVWASLCLSVPAGPKQAMFSVSLAPVSM